MREAVAGECRGRRRSRPSPRYSPSHTRALSRKKFFTSRFQWAGYKTERDIMTMGWHMMLGLSPALVECFIWDQNHSFDMIRRPGSA
jgi:hypothetical protein